jgi:hypothetical protein
MLLTFLPAIDEVSRDQAKKYERKFTSMKGADVPSEVSLSQDDDSLILFSLRYNESDVLSSLLQIWKITMGDFIPKMGKTIRIFPSHLVGNSTIGGKSVTHEVWHIWPEYKPKSTTDLPGKGVGKLSCVN